jgi:hypothetical protein
MKIRTCFVSNSSSSSFIVAKSYLTQKQQDGIRDWYKDLMFRANNDSNIYFGENGAHWKEDDNYLGAEVHGLSDEFDDLVDNLKIDRTKLCWTER